MIVAVLTSVVLYLLVAAVSYFVSGRIIAEEQRDHLYLLHEQASGHLQLLKEQVEKDVLLVSRNEDLLHEINTAYESSRQKNDRRVQVESVLSGMFNVKSSIYMITLFTRDNGSYSTSRKASYVFTLNDLEEINYFGHQILFKDAGSENGGWIFVETELAERSESRIFRAIYQERLSYVRLIAENMVIAITLDSGALQAALQGGEFYRYELFQSGDDVKVAVKASDGVFNAYGEGRKRQLNYLLIAVAALASAAAFLSVRYAKRLMQPIAIMKDQLTDIKRIDNFQQIMRITPKKLRTYGFRRRLFVFLLLNGLAGAVVIIVFNSQYVAGLIKKDYEQYFSEHVHQARNISSFVFESTENVVNAIIWDDRLQDYMLNNDKAAIAREMKNFFSYQHLINRSIKYLNIYNADGDIMFSTINSYLNEDKIMSRKVYETLQHTNGETIFVNEPSDPFGDNVIVIAKKINRVTGGLRLIGYYLYAIDSDQLGTMFNNLDQHAFGYEIVDSRGNVIYAHNFRPENERVLQLGETMQEPNWTIKAQVALSDIGAGIDRLNLFLAWSAVVLLMVLGLIVYLFALMIARPVEEIVQKIRTIVSSNFETKAVLPPSYGRDEISELSIHMEEMVNRIRELMNELYTVEVQKRELQLQHQQAELDYLIRQMTPHFLYNTLETVKWMAIDLTESENKVSEMIDELSAFLRYGVHTNDPVVRLKDELAHVRAYLYIQQIRYGSRLIVTWDVSSRLDEIPTLRFILQPVVENALKYGIERVKRRGRIRIALSETDGVLLIAVTDNGAGIHPEKVMLINAELAAVRHTFGSLSNIRQRMNHLFGPRSSLVVDSKPGHWTRVEIRLPWRQINANLLQISAGQEREGFHVLGYVGGR